MLDNTQAITMESKRLHLAENTPKITLTAEQVGDVEVGAGEFHYHLLQSDSSELTYTFHLRHPGSQIRVTGFINAQGTSPTLNTKVIHHAPQTKAETLIRTLAEGKATPRYTGLIRIEENAQDCESYLNHHSLLFGEDAHSWTIPSLEILANEVKCSHAATIRTITDADLFYPRSRGISADDARNLLIEAFLYDVQN